MEALGRWIRFIFAIRAFTAVIIPVHALSIALAYYRLHHPRPGMSPADVQKWFDFLLSSWSYLGHGVIGLVSLIAWWALRKGWPSARIWALAASVIGMFVSGPLGIGIGIAGVIAFWRPTTVSKVAGSPATAKRLAGDGTSRYIDKFMPFVLMGLLVASRVAWAVWGEHHHLPPPILNGWIGLVLAVHLGVFFHETGHFLAGLGSNMVLRQFQVGPVCGKVQDGHWRFSFNVAGLLGGGSVGMVPTYLENIRGRMVLMMLGGPVASLLTGSIATLLALSAKGQPWEPLWSFFAIFGTFGFLDFIANLTPTRPESHYSDGAQIYQLTSNGPWSERYLARAMVASSLATPRRPRDFDEGTLQRAAASLRTGEEGLYLGMFLAMHYLDDGKIEQGIAAWRAAIEQDPEAAAKLRPDTAAEMAFYEGAVAGDAERAHHWWNKVESSGDSRKAVDYWKGRTAILIVDGKLDEAAQAFSEAEQRAQKLPEAGAYEFDRWCVDVLRRKLNDSDLNRLSRATASQPATPVLT